MANKIKKLVVIKVGRDADNGRFTTVKKAEKNRKTHVVETIKLPIKKKPR